MQLFTLLVTPQACRALSGDGESFFRIVLVFADRATRAWLQVSRLRIMTDIRAASFSMLPFLLFTTPHFYRTLEAVSMIGSQAVLGCSLQEGCCL